jgi:hypothetical protein
VLIAGRRHQAACSSLCRDEANDTPVVALARESQCKFSDSDLQINIFLVESNSLTFLFYSGTEISAARLIFAGWAM